ncbi:SLC13 family permease [Deinococcus metallilatus]|uniref:Di/tricarboxylate transporter n=1 Tax=Deinococcus metallilatus TaxID=1211322 RepID=A0AAJ5F2G5_9DEIO|nr:SLC13 family permease [Deinococcus metallilatus]MBB5296722.1 di/tricarboxylate transporter [Deinococcus metallilatus]QBY09200.1 SLC13 family permease [Deinococcus metallilatus]RXJ09717.1 SLC13 family permease [Deinococcus metallilatus]TLK24183.1 SLC13 family permease [Deinococcus metallilatus]GMA13753.1 SLC13 family permease [Deinococcus metallilatus]
MDPVTILLILFVLALVLFATEWLPVDVTALLLLGALLALGLLTPKEAFAGFGSDTVLTLASLFILTRVLLRAGVIEWVGVTLARRARNAGSMMRGMLSAVAGVSAFTSNTATTAVFLPVVTGLARRAGIAPSRVLMPLAFSSILGGTITVIGTSTNLVVSGALPATGLKPLGFFELAWVGLPVAVVGLLYLFFVAPRLLPAQDAALEESLRAYLADLTVAPGSPLAGQTLRETGLGRDHGLIVVAVRRGSDTLYAPGPDFRVQEGDTLAVEGPSDRILTGKSTLGVFSKSEQKLQVEGTAPVRLVEAVVLPGSPLTGRTLRESRFRERYGVSVLALHRRARTVERLAGLRVQVGDVLLIQGSAERVAALGDYLTVLGDLTEAQRDLRKAPLALLLFGGAVVTGGLGLVPLSVAVVVAVALALALRLVSPEEAYRAVEWPVIVLVACMLAFGTAFEQTGAAKVLTGALSGVLEPLGPYGLLAALFAVTVALTQPMSNQAAALVMLPLAIGTAKALGYDPRPFVIAITIAASNSFITPLEPSCMLVYGPGRYRFMDFVRVGTGLTVVTFAVALLIIPQVWHF